MRILLDSNVWRYIVDANHAGKLQAIARRAKVEVLISPAVIYEALRLKDPELRLRLASAMTMPAWTRLMPEAYAEAEEFKVEVRRLHPEWIRLQVDPVLYRRLRFDWSRSRGGFWSRARNESDSEHRHLRELDRGELDSARAHALQNRRRLLESNAKPGQPRLHQLMCKPSEPVEGWDGEGVECWRVTGQTAFWAALKNEGHPYFQWSAEELNIDMMLLSEADFVRFWFYEVSRDNMRRAWLRAAFEVMQAHQKVTDGTPADCQLATYLVDADVVVTADKVFFLQAQRCHQDAPFTTADARLIPGGIDGVEALFLLIQSGI